MCVPVLFSPHLPFNWQCVNLDQDFNRKLKVISLFNHNCIGINLKQSQIETFSKNNTR